jgi:hypothetical protein
MNAHRTVILAAALTVAVAAALATVLATFSAQALPRAIRHDLGGAPGTAIAITGSVNASQAARYTSILPVRISAALDGTPFAFYQSRWSDPFGFVAGSRPAAPAGTGNTQIVEAAELGGITAHAVLLSGHWPGGPAGGQPDGAIPAALPATAAALLHVTVGDVLQLRDRISGQLARFAVTGLYRPGQVSSPYWNLNEVALSGSTTVGGFTTYGPLTVPASAFAGPLAVNGGSWLALPETAKVPAGQLRNVAGNVAALRNAVAAELLPALTLTTGLPAVLGRTASNLDLARSLLAICAVLLFLLAGAALLAVARLLAAQREGEAAMLTARGATRRQLVRMTVAEAAPLCLLASAAGAVAGVLIARMLAGTGPAPVSGAWPAAAAVGAGALVIMAVPAFSPVTPGAARAHRGRQAAVSRVTRAGADLALIALAVVAGWQLRHYTAVSAGANGDFGVDPVVVIAPALALAGGTVLALRLLPAGGKAGDRLAARGRRLTAALASWQISRQPIRQGGAALLIVLAVATATLALSQRQSWTRSDQDQAAFGAGADVRVQASQPLSPAQAGALARTPGVRHAMPVAIFPQPATNAETLALDARQAADVTRLRADQSPVPAAALFGMIVPAGPAPARATAVIPGLATRSFLAATNASVGSVVQTDVNGATIDVKIVAAVATFPTVQVSGGALVVDLGTLQRILNARSLGPAEATQWWLATSGTPPGVPPGLAASLPPGSAVTSASGTAAALLGNPLSTVPQQGMLAVAIAAAVLAVTGFCVSIAADVRQRRAETALLAALGVPPRTAAGQLCLEKLMLSVPSALAGLVLGVVLAELLVPAITLSATATTPVPPVLVEFGWSQTLPLALAVAVLPVLAAALTIARRPDPAAVLRAAEAG